MNNTNAEDMLSEEHSEQCTPPELRRVAEGTSENLLPKASKDKYLAMYNTFNLWRREKNAEIISENVLLAYFTELSEKYAPTSLWTKYSFLRSTIQLRHKIDISSYSQLLAFLKNTSKGYVPKKSKPLQEEDVKNFLLLAPDERYFFTKVALIFALFGALRIDELAKLEFENISELPKKKTYLVTVEKTKTHIQKSFTIKDEYYDFVKRYIDLRPVNTNMKHLFLNYQNGKCTNQNVGKNKLAAMPREIATFLNLENPHEYTGHSFRRTSANMVVNSGASTQALKLHGGWKSSKSAESYIDNSLVNQNDMSDRIASRIDKAFEPPFNPKRFKTASPVIDDNYTTSGIDIQSSSKGFETALSKIDDNCTTDTSRIRDQSSSNSNSQKPSKFKYKRPVFSHFLTRNDNSSITLSQGSQQLSQQSHQLSQFIIEDFVEVPSSIPQNEESASQVSEIIFDEFVNTDQISTTQHKCNTSNQEMPGHNFNFNNCNVTLNIHNFKNE